MRSIYVKNIGLSHGLAYGGLLHWCQKNLMEKMG